MITLCMMYYNTYIFNIICIYVYVYTYVYIMYDHVMIIYLYSWTQYIVTHYQCLIKD